MYLIINELYYYLLQTVKNDLKCGAVEIFMLLLRVRKHNGIL